MDDMDYAEALRNCTDTGADPDVLFGAADEIVALRECLTRARQICSNAHDMILRGADDSEICDMLEEGYGLTPNVEFNGDAPLHGAASAGTQGYASGGKE